MTVPADRLAAALADRNAIERELAWAAWRASSRLEAAARLMSLKRQDGSGFRWRLGRVTPGQGADVASATSAEPSL